MALKLWDTKGAFLLCGVLLQSEASLVFGAQYGAQWGSFTIAVEKLDSVNLGILKMCEIYQFFNSGSCCLINLLHL